MKDYPVIFRAPMVRALLDGRKTQTRRLASSPLAKAKPGDRLWVREAGLESKTSKLFKMFAHDATPGHYWVDTDGGRYGASYSSTITRESMVKDGTWCVRLRAQMPRWASRLTLVVTEVRFERLQDIREADAQAEGADPLAVDDEGAFYAGLPGATYRCGFAGLWNHLHGAGSWNENPELVVIGFEVHRVNIDQMKKVDVAA